MMKGFVERQYTC